MEVKMRSEEKLAKLFRERIGLENPVNIYSIVKEYADIEEDQFPFEIDAIFLNRQPRPLVILNKDRSERRKRFTLAHELGHIIIPWHLGTLACHTDLSVSSIDNEQYKEIELEANRFASEFLMPASWILEMLQEANLSDAIPTIIEGAQVSLIAACYQISKYLSPGYILCILRDETIKFAFSSQDTHIYRPTTIGELNKSITQSKNHGVIDLYGYTVHWLEFGSKANELRMDDVAGDPKELFNTILQEVYEEDSDRKKATNIVNGFFGSAFDRVNSPESLYTRVTQRMSTNDHIRPLIAHPKFNDFVIVKIQSLMSRANNK